MKLLLSAAIILTVSTGAAFAQRAGGGGGGSLHGSETYGTPLNSSYSASAVDPETGYTPGHGGNRFAPASTVKTKHVSKKKKHPSTTGSSSVR
jgi:hypothetical protein